MDEKSSHCVPQLKFIENGSRMAKGIQYIKTTQMINVNENFKKTNDKTNDKNSSITESLSMYNNTIFC